MPSDKTVEVVAESTLSAVFSLSVAVCLVLSLLPVFSFIYGLIPAVAVACVRWKYPMAQAPRIHIPSRLWWVYSGVLLYPLAGAAWLGVMVAGGGFRRATSAVFAIILINALIAVRIGAVYSRPAA